MKENLTPNKLLAMWWVTDKKAEILMTIVGFFTGFISGIMFVAWAIEGQCKGNHAVVFDNKGMHHAVREEKETTK